MLNHSKSAPPLYSQLKEIIKGKILNETYPINENIPTEKELQENYQVSRITVRKALDELLNEGYIERQQGRGTIVLRKNIIEEELHVDRSFTEEMKGSGIVPGTKSIKLNTVRAQGAIARALGMKSGASVLELIRVRTADGLPIVIFKSYIDPELIQITEEEVAENESLYLLLQKKGRFVRLTKETFEVTLSTEWNSQQLELPLGSPLLKRTTVVHSDGEPIIYTESTYNGYVYRYYMSYE